MSITRRLLLTGVVLSALGCRVAATPQAGPTADDSPRLTAMPPTSEPAWPLRGRLYTDARVETDGREGADFDVDVSPDGTRIVFSSTRFTTAPKVFSKDLRGGGVTQKTNGAASDIQPKFSPDGNKIAFASNRYGNYDILVVPASGGNGLMQLTNSPADEIHPTWSPEAKRIAYCMLEDDQWNIWIIDLDGQRRTKLGPGMYPEWSPDGALLAFQRPSMRGRGWHGIWVVEVEGGSPREIATAEDRASIQPSWAPNSRRMVFATARSPEERPFDPPRADDLWIVDLEGGYRYQLTEHPSEDYAPNWGLDGRIYFTSLRGGTPGIWSVKPVDPRTLFGDDGMPLPSGGRP
ncbi:MAG: TolB family protein [Planctomycetota bacterium]